MPIVKGRLRAAKTFWKSINANPEVLDIIESGYKLPLLHAPDTVILKNNKSALNYSEFVLSAIEELKVNNVIIETDSIPHVVNPLSVAIQSSRKKRLILDLRYVHQFLWKSKIKFDDWNVALEYFKQGDFMFSFDLKSGYHHIQHILVLHGK